MSVTSKSSSFLGKWGVVIFVSVMGLGILLCIMGIFIVGGVVWFQNTSRSQSSADQTSTTAPMSAAVQPTKSPQGKKSTQVEKPTQTVDSTQPADSTQTPEPTQSATPTQMAEVKPANAQSVLLVDLQGIVETKAGEGDWQTAQIGQTLLAGQSLRTGDLSSARLAFYDGSLAQLGPQTELLVESLDARADGPRIIQLRQLSGETQYTAAKSSDSASRYEVNTPAGNGSAQGTVFSVVVVPKQLSRFWVDEGVVNVTHRNVTVTVVAGQVTTVPEWTTPSQPYYRITAEGEASQTGDNWVVARQSFITGPTTIIWGNPQNGDWVRVEGHFLTNGARFADHIVLLRRAVENQFDFSGVVDTINQKDWTISGRTVNIDQSTSLEAGLAVGDKVQVSGRVAPDGVLWAVQIRLWDESIQRFHFTGLVESQTATAWTVSGISLTVNASTTLVGEIKVGDVVIVDGKMASPDQWIATSIQKAKPNDYHFEFNGVVQSLLPWLVSGISFDTADWTEIDDGINVGAQVYVTGIVQSGGVWVAEKIVKLALEPKLRFSFIGPVISLQPWQIGNMLISVTPQTEIKGDIVVGEMVKVTGWVLQNGVWEAAEIKHTGRHLGWGCMDLHTVVLSIDQNQLALLNGQTIDVAGISVTGEIKEASVVLYHICLDRPAMKETIVYMIFVYQLDSLPVLIIDSGAPSLPAGCKVSKNGHIKCSKKKP